MNVIHFWKNSSLYQKVIFLLYIICFLIATSTHTRDLINDGFLPYDQKPLWANIYWTLLTLADPLAIILLLINHKKGILIFGIIIISDVLINLFFTMTSKGIPGILNIFMVGQIFFLLLYLCTCKQIYSISSFKDIVYKYFRSWILKDSSIIKSYFSEKIEYSECYGPVYQGKNQCLKWFKEWNIKGSVLKWDIKKTYSDGRTFIVEWFFECEYEGNRDDFEGSSIIDFSTKGKIISIKEFQSKSQHHYPYGQLWENI